MGQLMVKRMRKNKLNYLACYSFIFFVLVNCSNKSKKVDCSSVQKIRESIETNVDLSVINAVFIKVYKKNSLSGDVLKHYDSKILAKKFNDKKSTWNFTLADSLDINFDYEICFPINDSIKFKLSNLTIGEWAAYTNDGEGWLCTLSKCNINGIEFVDMGNLKLNK